MRYVVFKRFRDKCLSGMVNLPYGTVCELDGEMITKDGNALVVATSENAHQYFSRDDDGRGLERGRLTQEIQKRLAPPPMKPRMTPLERKKRDDEIKRQIAAWARIWNDPKLQKFKMREHADHWLWNHAFFNAEIEDLTYILNVIEGGTPCTE